MKRIKGKEKWRCQVFNYLIKFLVDFLNENILIEELSKPKLDPLFLNKNKTSNKFKPITEDKEGSTNQVGKIFKRASMGQNVSKEIKANQESTDHAIRNLNVILI